MQHKASYKGKLKNWSFSKETLFQVMFQVLALIRPLNIYWIAHLAYSLFLLQSIFYILPKVILIKLKFTPPI